MAYWFSLIGGLGIGSILGGLVQQYFSAKQRHREWVKDNKKLEWRELIDELEKAITRMSFHFPAAIVKASEESTDWKSGLGMGSKVIRDRIFIAAVVKERGIVKKWGELVQYVLSVDNPREPTQQGGLPTINGYNLKAIELQDLLIRVSGEDLDID